MNESQIFAIVLHAIVIASVAHAILPPYDIFNDFPKVQKYYKLLLAIVAYVALNVRTSVIQAYPSAKKALTPEPPKDA